MLKGNQRVIFVRPIDPGRILTIALYQWVYRQNLHLEIRKVTTIVYQKSFGRDTDSFAKPSIATYLQTEKWQA